MATFTRTRESCHTNSDLTPLIRLKFEFIDGIYHRANFSFKHDIYHHFRPFRYVTTRVAILIKVFVKQKTRFRLIFILFLSNHVFHVLRLKNKMAGTTWYLVPGTTPHLILYSGPSYPFRIMLFTWWHRS
jgi:hypothetical protein